MTVNPPRPPMDPEVLAELLPLTQVIADTVHSTHLTLGPGGDEDLICALTVTVAAWAGQYILPSRARELVVQTSAAVPGPPATRAADRDRIAQVIREFPFDDFGLDDVSYLLEGEPDTQEWVPRLAGAVLAVLPPPTARAAVCICGHTEAQHFEDVCITEVTSCGCGDYLPVEAAAEEIARLRRMADKAQQPEGDERSAGVSALTDKLKRVRALHRETCILARGEIGRTAFKCGMCEALDTPTEGGARRAADEEQPANEAEPTAQPECAHCWREIENRGTPSMGSPSHDNWVHIPGGFTVCFPQRGSDSPRAEPRTAS